MSRVEKAWCDTCRRMQAVEDQSVEGHYEYGREVEYLVTHLACGHSTQGHSRVVGSAPGQGTGGFR